MSSEQISAVVSTGRAWALVSAWMAWGLTTGALATEPVDRVVVDLLKNHPRIEAARSDLASALLRETETRRRLWRPNVDFGAEAGKQQYTTESITSPWRDVDRWSIRGTQLIYDFARADAQVSEFAAVASQAEAVARATEDGVLLESLTAHWSALRARMVLDYARRSEASVRNLTQMETSLVELGRGYESNVLQAKVQLAGAEARRIRAEGALDIANARVAALFGQQSQRLGYDKVAIVKDERLPRTLQAAIDAAITGNRQLKVGIHRSQALRHRLAGTEARETRPKLELAAEVGQRRNWDSAIDGARVEDKKVLLQLNWNFNAGMAGRAAAESARHDLDASVRREAEALELVREQVSIAWRNWLVARQNKDTLANQVRIAAKFFEMATAERQLGRRSLLDVLTAEVALINAMSDLAATEADAAIASLTVLQVTGLLSMDSLRVIPAKEALPGASLP